MAQTVRVEDPAGARPVEIEVEPGESVAEAAWRQGYTWPTKCFGQQDCMVCFTKILAGEEMIEEPADDELFAMRTKLPRRLRGSLVRLGCRVRVGGPGVVLEKKGVRAPAGDAPADADPRPA